MPILGTIASSYAASPYAAVSYESIATASGGGNGSTITFSSIPQTYKHLEIRYFARSAAGANRPSLGIQYNGDSASNYPFALMSGNSAGTLSYSYDVAGTGYGAGLAGPITSAQNTATYYGVGIIHFMDYTNTTTRKQQMSYGTHGDLSDQYLDLRWSMRLNSNGAITSLYLFTYNAGGAGGFTTDSKFALYGIKG